MPRTFFFYLFGALLLGLLQPAAVVRADRLILRSLEIITDRTVSAVDDEGVVLDNGKRLGWHEIEKGTIAADKQAAFDAMLKERGESLYRIRQRITTADYVGALQPAEGLFAKYVGSTSDTAYLVKQAVMWGRIAAGKREEALEAYLLCVELLRARPAAAKSLPGDRRLQWNNATGLSVELIPCWFRRDAAKAVLPVVYQRIAEMKKPRLEGAYIYYASLALAADEPESATKTLKAIRSSHRGLLELQLILEAQQEVARGRRGESFAKLEQAAEAFEPANRPLAWYWLGLGKLQPGLNSEQLGLLELLKIPALAGRQQPELAAAALHRVMEVLAAKGDSPGSVAVRRELLERYGQTYYAVRARGTQETEKTP